MQSQESGGAEESRRIKHRQPPMTELECHHSTVSIENECNQVSTGHF